MICEQKVTISVAKVEQRVLDFIDWLKVYAHENLWMVTCHVFGPRSLSEGRLLIGQTPRFSVVAHMHITEAVKFIGANVDTAQKRCGLPCQCVERHVEHLASWRGGWVDGEGRNEVNLPNCLRRTCLRQSADQG